MIFQESNRTGYVKIEEVCEYIYCVMCAPLHAGLEEGNPIYIYIYYIYSPNNFLEVKICIRNSSYNSTMKDVGGIMKLNFIIKSSFQLV